MALFRITDKGPQQMEETKLKEEKLLEEHLEDWVSVNPSILGEPLLVIGRQVIFPDTKDRLDVLAVDPQGNAVVIEIKRGQLKDPVEIQSLRYASYISKWRYEDLENTARDYLRKESDPDFNFNSLFEEFCENIGIDEIPDVNGDQRVIVIGSDVKDKLGSVALWLREHSVDIKLFEIHAYKENGKVLIEPNQIVPLQVSRFSDVGKMRIEGSPWISDARSWHLEKRCSASTKDRLLFLDNLLRDNLELEEPSWNQKNYIAYRYRNYNWLCVHTGPKTLVIDVYVQPKSFEAKALAVQLGVKEFDRDESLSEKLGLPSSVNVRNRNDATDRVRLRAKSDFGFDSAAFLQFIKTAYEKCAK